MNSAVNFSCAITPEVVMGYLFPLNISLITDLPTTGSRYYEFSCEFLLCYNPGGCNGV